MVYKSGRKDIRAQLAVVLLHGCLCVVALTGFFALAAPTQAADKSYTIPAVNIQAQVATNGAMLVTEERDYDFTGDYRFAYRDFIVSSDPKQALGRTEAYRLGKFKVCDESTCYQELAPGQVNWDQPRANKPGTFVVSRHDNQIRVQWHFVAVSTLRHFKLSYVVENAVTQQADSTELYWQWIGKDWTVSQSNVNVALTLPPGIADDKLQAWAHGPLNGRVAIPKATQVVFTVPRLPAGQFFEGRVVWPKGVVSGGASATANLAAIRAQEIAFITETKEQLRLYEQYLTLLQYVVRIVTGVALISFIGVAWQWWRTHKDQWLPRFLLSSQGEWAPPSDLDPAQVDELFSLKNTLRPAAFTALVLSLVQRRFYKLRRSATKQGWFRPDYQYYLEPVAVSEKQITTLSEVQRSVWGFLQAIPLVETAELDGGPAAVLPFKKLIEWVGQHRTSSFKFFQKLGLMAEKANFRDGLLDKKAHTHKKFFAIAGAVFGGGGLLVFVLIVMITQALEGVPDLTAQLHAMAVGLLGLNCISDLFVALFSTTTAKLVPQRALRKLSAGKLSKNISWTIKKRLKYRLIHWCYGRNIWSMAQL